MRPPAGFGSGGGGPSLTGSGGGAFGGGPSLGAGGTAGGGSEPESGAGGGVAGGGGPAGGGASGGGGTALPELKDAQGNVVPPDFQAPKFDFVVQFAWKPGELATVTGPAAASAPAPAAPAGGMEPESGN